jgi:2-polyprenyl-3-methyl-5-hydroxy-6-metoxy-1,4-benzoquinol methylase
VNPVRLNVNPWDRYAAEYSRWIGRREPVEVDSSSIMGRLLEILGDLSGRDVLDAGCGEGYFSRVLAARGARVTGIDLSSRLIEIAREKDPNQTIDYRVADLSQPIPDLESHFNLIGSHLVLNDVEDYRGFAATLSALARPGARLALALNNPYSSVVREHIADYFISDSLAVYQGMSRDVGGQVHYYHRTLEEYLDAFLGAGLRLIKLADIVQPPGRPGGWLEGRRFPFFVVLGFEKPLAAKDGSLDVSE